MTQQQLNAVRRVARRTMRRVGAGVAARHARRRGRHAELKRDDRRERRELVHRTARDCCRRHWLRAPVGWRAVGVGGGSVREDRPLVQERQQLLVDQRGSVLRGVPREPRLARAHIAMSAAHVKHIHAERAGGVMGASCGTQQEAPDGGVTHAVRRDVADQQRRVVLQRARRLIDARGMVLQPLGRGADGERVRLEGVAVEDVHHDCAVPAARYDDRATGRERLYHRHERREECEKRLVVNDRLHRTSELRHARKAGVRPRECRLDGCALAAHAECHELRSQHADRIEGAGDGALVHLGQLPCRR
eukprot:2865652-Prymnesium_polylepis.2